MKKIETNNTVSPAEEKVIFQRIHERKKELAGKVLILCHHYQHDSVFQFADLSGDSLKLARDAAEAGKVPNLIFCGVHFMAESADILTGNDQAVFLPDLKAGCPMADMAVLDEVESAWLELASNVNTDDVVPVTYVNSSANIKAFVGERGGSVCTSSNAERVLKWALNKGEKVFFFPDEHLGRNSAVALNVPDDEIVLWQRGKKFGGNSMEQLQEAKVILWDGYCHVHMEFSGEQIKKWRKQEPGIQVIIHPESRHNAVRQADAYGSTEAIISAVEKSSPGSTWAIGTEVNLVNRLKEKHPDKNIHLLADTSCECDTMACITPEALLRILDNLSEGRPDNQVTVEESIAGMAKLALDRMLEI